jgi:hypothetical protein
MWFGVVVMVVCCGVGWFGVVCGDVMREMSCNILPQSK